MALVQLKRKPGANTLLIIVASVLGTLIVLSIVGVISKQTGKNEAEARMHVELNELGAIAGLRVIVTTAATYRDSYHHYPRKLSQLGPPASGRGDEDAGDLIDSRLASGIEDGYKFSFATKTNLQGAEEGFEAHADPLSASTGVRHFYVNETGVIRWDNRVATGESQLLE